jgi:uncharacterized RmlC-like cupin family protein
MKTISISQAEMESRIARFKSLSAYQQHQASISNLPPAVLEKIAANRVYPIMVPEGYKGRSTQAPIKSAPGLIISIAECPAGDGPGLHSHDQAIENFMCLNGRFRIDWGDKGENSATLEPLDFISIPPFVLRRFTNISNETARLLAIIHVQSTDQADQIAFSPDLAKEIARDFGKDTLKALDGIGIKFNAGVDSDAPLPR